MKGPLKQLVKALALVAVMPLYVQTRILELFLGTDQPFQMASHSLSLCPGIVGNYLRVAFYRLTLPRCGTDACIEFGTIIHQPTVEIGRRVYIGCHCSIGESIIEDDVLIGSNVDIISGREQHSFLDPDVPIREQAGRLRKVVIGADSWIGNSAIVMANTGAKSVVASGSVVVHDLESRSVVAGNPARVIRRRP